MTMSKKRNYPESKSRRWLAWLARCMTERGETVFMIERLQPDCLTGGQLWAYGLMSRIAGASVAFSLFFLFVTMLALIAGASGLEEMVIGALSVPFAGTIAGILAGTIVGFSVIAKFERRKVYGILAGIAAAAMIVAVVGLLNLVARIEGEAGVAMVGFGLLATPFVILWTRRVARRSIDDDIRPIESLRFSWKTFRQRAFRKWWLYVLLLPVGSYIVFAINCVRAIFAAYTVAPADRKTRPNEGIHLSIRNAFFAWGSTAVVGAAIGLAAGAGISLAASGLPFTGEGSATGDFFGAALVGALLGGAAMSLVGIFFGFWFGGLDAVNHFVLRLVLWANGCVPLRLARFLDHAARDLGFVQPVGGGYMFIHRYLLEHFARMSEPAPAPVPPAAQPAPVS